MRVDILGSRRYTAERLLSSVHIFVLYCRGYLPGDTIPQYSSCTQVCALSMVRHAFSISISDDTSVLASKRIGEA
jgi:hypothetical protein